MIADRGASLEAPENTFAAFDKAQQQGAVGLQAEVQLSKDGRVVLFSDETLFEKTGAAGSVKDHDLSELSKLDLAPWFARTHASSTASVKADANETPSRVTTTGAASPNASQKAKAGGTKKLSHRSRSKQIRETVSTEPLTHLVSLEDVFERYGLTLAYSLVLKSDDPELVNKIAGLTRAFSLQNNVTFVSSNYQLLFRAQSISKDLPLVYLIDDAKTPELKGEIARARTLGFSAVAVRASLITKELVKRVHSSQLSLRAYDVKSDDDLKRIADLGVDALTTPDPAHAMSVLKRTQAR